MRTSLTRKQPLEDGFTMIEVLVAMVVLSVTTAIVVGTILGAVTPKAVYEAAEIGPKSIETWLVQNPETNLVGTADYLSPKDFMLSVAIDNKMSEIINLPSQDNLEYKLAVTENTTNAYNLCMRETNEQSPKTYIYDSQTGEVETTTDSLC